jgi:anti-sigma-K factor RskA
MRMRQSLAEFEEAFHEEAVTERERRSLLRHQAAQRSRTRRHDRVERHGNLRFAGLVLAILATSVIVTLVMFESLALLIGP